ncbi:MAG: ribosome maturation factor RimM [Fusobacteria bacterium]|nr:ribosome maturation factor RimM [Fusobacteriota bacterium]
MDNLIRIGQIMGTYKLKGEVKLVTLIDEYDALVGQSVLLSNEKTGKERVIEVEAIKPINAKKLSVKFKGIDFITEAQELNLMSIYVRRDILGISEDEYFIADLIGLKVVDEVRGEIGIVESILETGAHDILVVKKGSKETLIPANEPFLLEIDFEEKTIYVELIEGM